MMIDMNEMIIIATTEKRRRHSRRTSIFRFWWKDVKVGKCQKTCCKDGKVYVSLFLLVKFQILATFPTRLLLFLFFCFCFSLPIFMQANSELCLCRFHFLLTVFIRIINMVLVLHLPNSIDFYHSLQLYK